MAYKNRGAVLAFKKECRNYFYYLADIRTLQQEMTRLHQSMVGTHSIDLTRVKITSDRFKTPVVRYIEAKQSLENQMEEAKGKVANIINTIGSVEPSSFRAAIWMLYIQRRTVKEVADLYGLSRDYLADKIIEIMDDVVPPLPEGKKAEPMLDDEGAELINVPQDASEKHRK